MTLKEAVDSTVRGYLYRTLSDTGGDVPSAARIAGMSRQSFYRVLRRYGIYAGKMARGDAAPGARHIPRAGAQLEGLPKPP